MLVKVICRSMGYAHGSVSSSACGFYGAADLCGAAGSPVAGSLLQHFNGHFIATSPRLQGHGGSKMLWVRVERGGQGAALARRVQRKGYIWNSLVT